MRRVVFAVWVFWLAVSQGAQAGAIFNENFQDGDATGWKVSGKGKVQLTRYAGNHSLRLTKKKSAITAVATGQYSKVRVSLEVAADSLEKFDKCYAEVSPDAGENWSTLVEVSDGQDDGVTFHSGHAALDETVPFILIRFRAAGKDNSDYCWGDNVRVSGVPTSGGKAQMSDGVRTQLDHEVLSAGEYSRPVAMSAFARPFDATDASQQFQGRLTLSGIPTENYFEVLRDDYNFAGSPSSPRRRLPDFNFEFVQEGSDILPVRRGTVANSHPDWEFILEPGKVWDEALDQGYSRAAIPFALQEKNANCIHNGVITFLFKSDGSVSRAAFQISNETCVYFRFNMWSLLETSYEPYVIKGANQVVKAYRKEVRQRMPVKPIAALATDYPGADPRRFGDVEEIDPEDMTLYGFVIDGIHYRSGCETRQGSYPYCDVMAIPSYSTAKSAFAGLAMMRLEKLYPDSTDLSIADYVPECSADKWADVTFEHALDMSTGNYESATADVDEGAKHAVNGLFIPERHVDKINYSCQYYTRKDTPGKRWVYHTSDTYILGTAMNAFLKRQKGGTADIYNDVVANDIWRELGLSPGVYGTRRTYDDIAQPFTGWGLSYHADDVAKIANFLNLEEGRVGGDFLFDPALLASAMQRNPDDRGLPARDQRFRYNNGFWGHDVAPYLGCDKPTWLPYMSGYGGIIVLMMPNDTSYYYFSDSGTHRWSHAALESHKIRGYCQ